MRPCIRRRRRPLLRELHTAALLYATDQRGLAGSVVRSSLVLAGASLASLVFGLPGGDGWSLLAIFGVGGGLMSALVGAAMWAESFSPEAELERRQREALTRLCLAAHQRSRP